MSFRLPEVHEGDELSADAWNEDRKVISRGLIALRGHRGVIVKQTPQGSILNVTPERCRLGKVGGSSIGAVSTDTLQSGTGRLYTISSAGVRTEVAVDRTFYNPSSSSIPSGSWVLVNVIDGLLVITNRVDC